MTVYLYTEELADRICEELASGRSLRQICRDDGMPTRATVVRWLRDKEDFRERYCEAREVQADHYFDEILEIADDGTNDYRPHVSEDGTVVFAFDKENVQRSRLRIDARKWVLGRMNAKKYGDRITQDVHVTGGVLAVAPAATSVEEWEAQAGGEDE